MANTNVPFGLLLKRLEGSEVRVEWTASARNGYSWNIYAGIAGTGSPLPGPPLNSSPWGTQSYTFDLGDVAGNSPPGNNIEVAVTSINNTSGQESSQSALLPINVDAGDPGQPHRVIVGRAPSGEPTYLATDEDGTLKSLVSLSPPAGGFATEATLGGVLADTSSIDGKLPVAVASEATVATLATEATAATLGTEATLATRATEATLATRASEVTLAAADTKLGTIAGDTTSIDGKLPATVASEATLATLATEATLSAQSAAQATAANQVTGNASLATIAGDTTSIDGKLPAAVASEATLATRASEATLATRASEVTVATLGTEATLATRATESTLATRASETTLAAADTKLGTIAGDTTSLDGKVPSQGQALMAASLPVVVASDQSPVDVLDLLSGADEPTAVPVTATSVDLVATTPNTSRKLLFLMNVGNSDVLIGVNDTNLVPLAPDQPLTLAAKPAIVITGERPVGSGNVIVWEFS